MQLTSGLKISFLLLVAAAMLVVLSVTALKKFDVRGKKPSLFLILNLVTVVIFLSSRSPSSSSDEYEVVEVAVSEGNQAKNDESDDDNDFQESSKDVEVTDEDWDVASDEHQDECYSSDIEDNNIEDDSDEEDSDCGELQMRADEFIANMMRGWMEERLRDAMLIRPP